MPILDASTLTGESEDENVLRGILGRPTHGPLHADAMRAAACDADNSTMRHDQALSSAITGSEHTANTLINRIHSSM
jgi:hypothetical protein